MHDKSVVAEVTIGALPEDWPWGVLCGIEELAYLFNGVPVDIYSMTEGTIFQPTDYYGYREPVVRIEGNYINFTIYETPLLGFLCQASGIATRAARIRKIAGNKRLLSFGIRRMHPAISPMIDRAMLIGGFDALSCLAGAKITATEPVGTMPHALILLMGDQIKALQAFDEAIEKKIPRVALVDTFSDEKIESLLAADTLENLDAVRLDTPASRRGDFPEIIREVRWELNLHNHNNVKILVSGGLTENSIGRLCEADADGFGVGTYVSNSPTVNFAMDIVEVNGQPCAKKGKLGGKKEVWRCKKCFVDLVLPYSDINPNCPKCGGKMNSLLRPLIKDGKIILPLPEPKKIREHVLRQIEQLPLDKK